jgi:toxin ParE1/3/4
MKIIYTRPALRDLEEISAYSAKDNPHAAKKLIRLIQSAIDVLVFSPKMGRQTNRPAVHVLTIPRTPYPVFYQLNLDEIYSVLTIRHAKRHPVM